MKAASERNPVHLAVLGLTLIAVVLVLAMNFQRLPLVGGGTTYRAEFADAAGLVKGEEVRVAGIKVGAVTAITLEGDRVEVEFLIDGVDLGDRTTASIEVKTLLGQHHLSLSPAGSGRLDPDDVIPLERTSTPLNIVPAFQRLTEQTQEIDTAQVAAAFDSLSSVLTSTAPELTGTLTGLSRLSRAVSSRDEQLRKLFARAGRVTGVVAARDKEIGQLLRASNSVLDVLARRRDTIARIIDGTSVLARQLRGLVADNEETLRPALASLNQVLAVLRANRAQLEETLKWTAVYAREFTSVGGSGHWFDASVKFPRGFALCNNDTGPLGRLLGPVLTQANEAVNGSSTPCLPLGPATGSSATEGDR
jgi:phospholipid/cholesterol/gamma-HCH transport system substrate-binding protein